MNGNGARFRFDGAQCSGRKRSPTMSAHTTPAFAAYLEALRAIVAEEAEAKKVRRNVQMIVSYEGLDDQMVHLAPRKFASVAAAMKAAETARAEGNSAIVILPVGSRVHTLTPSKGFTAIEWSK